MTTQSFLIRDPPQIWRPFTLREICQGQACGEAFSPFTTRAEYGLFPQPKMCFNEATLLFRSFREKRNRFFEMWHYKMNNCISVKKNINWSKLGIVDVCLPCLFIEKQCDFISYKEQFQRSKKGVSQYMYTGDKWQKNSYNRKLIRVYNIFYTQ